MSAGIPDQVRCPERLQAVRQAQLIGEAPAPGIIRLVELAATLMDAPLAFFTVVDDERSWYHAAVGIPEDLDSGAVEGSFCKYVIASTEPLVVGDAAADVRTIGNPAIASMGVRAWAGHPVRDPDGHILGSFCVVDTSPRDWTDRDVELLAVLAAAADDEVANHRMRMAEIDARARFEESRTELDVLRASQYEVLELLQRSLLPTSVPPVAGLDIAVRYESASHASGLGGDWYDVIDLGDDRFLLVVGDVVGHGIESAAAMGKLATATRALAQMEQAPGALLQQLDQLAATDPTTQFASMAIVLVDQRAGELRYSLAGHPPPLLRRADGSIVILDGARSVALGGISVQRPEHTVGFDGAVTVLLYTDGINEAQQLRPEPAKYYGLQRIRRVLARGPTEPVALVEALMNDVAQFTAGSSPDDDVCLVAVDRAREWAGPGPGFKAAPVL